MNLEVMDKTGVRMQGTLFKELVDQYAPIFQVGQCFEIIRVVVKPSQSKYTQNQNEHCFVFDRNSKVIPIDD